MTAKYKTHEIRVSFTSSLYHCLFLCNIRGLGDSLLYFLPRTWFQLSLSGASDNRPKHSSSSTNFDATWAPIGTKYHTGDTEGHKLRPYGQIYLRTPLQQVSLDIHQNNNNNSQHC